MKCPKCDKLTAENERLEAELKWWQDREAAMDAALTKQRAVPSSEIVRELEASALVAAVYQNIPAEKATRLLSDAAARIDALEQEAVRRDVKFEDHVIDSFCHCIDNAAMTIDGLKQELAKVQAAKDHAVSLELADQNDEVAAKAEAELADLNELRRLVEAFDLAESAPMYDSEPWWKQFYDAKNAMLAHVRKMREAVA